MKGGPRKGAGRKRGSANQKTREIADAAAAAGITPLEYMLKMLRIATPRGSNAEVRARYDVLRFEAAKAAAPYLHPRLAPRDSAIKLAPAADTLAGYAQSIMMALRGGELTPDQASKVMAALAAHARIVEVDELERRVKALEDGAKQGDRHGS